MMRVVHAVRFGGPEVLTLVEAPDPVPEPGNVVIGVTAADVLFLDTQLRNGWGQQFFTIEPPYVPGAGVAGTVLSVGDGVDQEWTGKKVVVSLGQMGGYAEQVQAPADQLIEVPSGVDPRVAVASLHDGATALSRIEKAKIQPGDQVLITAAGGSLGGWLIPLAKAAGAQVIATARGTRKLESARQLGADVGVDYTQEDWSQQVLAATDGHGIDVVFDGAGGPTGRAAFELTARGGRFFSYGAASGDFAPIEADEASERGVTVTGVADPLTPADRRRFVQQGLADIAAGRIRPVIGATYALGHASDAHAAIEARSVVGKTVLEV